MTHFTLMGLFGWAVIQIQKIFRIVPAFFKLSHFWHQLLWQFFGSIMIEMPQWMMREINNAFLITFIFRRTQKKNRRHRWDVCPLHCTRIKQGKLSVSVQQYFLTTSDNCSCFYRHNCLIQKERQLKVSWSSAPETVIKFLSLELS